MKLKIQRTDTALILGSKMSKEDDFETLADDGASVYEMAALILARYPRFKEIIISTELSDDEFTPPSAHFGNVHKR